MLHGTVAKNFASDMMNFVVMASSLHIESYSSLEDRNINIPHIEIFLMKR